MSIAGEFKRGRSFCALLLALAVGLLLPPTALAHGPEPAKSDETAACCYNVRLLTNEGIAQAGKLFRLLEVDGDIRFEPVFNGDAVSPQGFWRQHFGVWVGPFRASGIEAWLCERNPHICRAASGFDQMRKAPPGTDPSVAGLSCDGKLPAYVICLPTLEIATYEETTTRQIDRSVEDLATIVTGNLLGCDSWGTECQHLVANLNSSRLAAADPDTKTYKGPIRLPFKAIRVQLAARPGESAGEQTARTTEMFERFRTASGLDDKKGLYAVLTDERTLSSRKSVSQILTSVEDGSALEAKAQKAIAYPYVDAASRARRAQLPPVTVAVWDKFVDDRHCAFKIGDKSAIRYTDEVARKRLEDDQVFITHPRPPGPCAALRSSFVDSIDHGTAVAGLIASQPINATPGGLNPGAEIWNANLDDLLHSEDDPILEFSKRASVPLTVINVSQDFPEGRDSQLDRILFGDTDKTGSPRGRHAADIVFVIAAGNAGDYYPGKPGASCKLYPACPGALGDGLAIISVSASNADGNDILRCSAFAPGEAPGICSGQPASRETVNYGREFDVMAPGLAFTTLYGDTFGEEAGTSMAAPRVSALASLLVAAASKSLPGGVKQVPRALDVRARILATADPVRNTGGDPFVRFGAVNFRRALDFETSVVEPMDVTDTVICATAPLDCRLLGWRVRDLPLKGTIDEKKFSTSWLRVLRLQFLEDRGEQGGLYHVVYLEPAAAAVRQAQVLIAPTEQVTFYTDANAKWKPVVTTLREFTACAFASLCPSVAP